MAWLLQTPHGSEPKLLQSILDQCGPALNGGGAFAFASAQGIKMLVAEPVFSKFLTAHEFALVVGLDAITDMRAVEELRKVSKTHSNLKAKLFLHSRNGSLFHPKTLWLKTAKGGVIITGSGNLTSGGLKSNWEAMAVETLSVPEMAMAEKVWDEWVKAHSKELVDLDDPRAIEKAKSNTITRTKIKKALKEAGADDDIADAAIDAVEEAVEEIEHELLLNRVLIAEIPRSKDRWEQVNFSKKSYEEFFGVKSGTKRFVRFYRLEPDGSLGVPEDRESVSVKSHNYRFEVGAAKGKPYPDDGHPICIFEQTGDKTFNYVLLMPSDPAHKLVQDYLDANHVRSGNQKHRVQITAGALKSIWPDAPFFK